MILPSVRVIKMNESLIKYNSMSDGDLCIRFREEKDETALKILLKRHAGFCYSEALKRHKYGLSVEDLVDAGKIGLYEASLQFDPERGVKFLSFAGEYVKNYMRHIVREDGTKKTGKTEPIQNDRIALISPQAVFSQMSNSLEERVIRKERTRQLKACFRQLSVREQRILLDKFFDPPYLWALHLPGKETKDKELAREFDIPQRLLRKNLNAAYKKLREGLEIEDPAQRLLRQSKTNRREKGTYIQEDFWIIG